MRRNLTKWLFKLQAASFFATIIFLPIQLSKFFWPDFSFVLGLRIDYLAPSLYLSDFSILTFIASSTILSFLTKEPFKNSKLPLIISLFLLGVFASTVTAHSSQVASIKAAKILEFSLFAVFVSRLTFKKIFPQTLLLFALSLFWISLLSLLQFGKQESLGLAFLGERTFSLSTPGISQITHDGALFLRPYATFPHPNVLAGYIVLSLTLVFGYFLFFNPRPILKWFLIFTSFLAIFALFLTFSRAGWTASFLGLLFLFIIFLSKKTTLKLLKVRKIFPAFLMGLLFGVIAIFLFPIVFERFFSVTTSDSHSLLLRAKLAQASISMVQTSPVLGVGPGNFLTLLPNFWDIQETIRFIQPAHNIFLLVASELGIFGFLAFSLILVFCLSSILKMRDSFLGLILLTLFGQVIFLAFFDHYFWTLQQGLILFWLFVGLFSGSSYEGS